MNKNIQTILTSIIDVKDFPKKGIIFKDITPLMLDIKVFKKTIKELKKLTKGWNFDAVAATESRGFWFGIPLAYVLKKPFIPIRKKNKLPRETVSKTYDLEYGQDTISIHKEDIKPNQKVLIVDDVIATGGTLVACIDLFKQIGANVEGIAVLMEIESLENKEILEYKNLQKIRSLIKI